MDEQQRKAQVKKTFDTVAEGYGGDGMAFFHNAAARLPEVMRLRGDEHVLDVATGTGLAASVIARQLPQGHVTGIDLSGAMLAQARERARQAGIDNLALAQMDMQHLPFAPARFDAANCSFGLFFLPDMAALLRQIARQVKPGGAVVACSFYRGSFEPNIDLFLTRIAGYGVTVPELMWRKICTEPQITELFAQAGLSDIETQRYDIGDPLSEVDAWWRLIWYAGFRGLVAQLDEARLAQFKHEHLSEIAALKTERGIPLRVEVLFARGRVTEAAQA